MCVFIYKAHARRVICQAVADKRGAKAVESQRGQRKDVCVCVCPCMFYNRVGMGAGIRQVSEEYSVIWKWF